MTDFRHESSVWLPAPRSEVFPFFAKAGNLEVITPDWLSFRVVTPPPIEMAEGARIEYRLRLHGLPFRWESRIEVWDPPLRFVDRQLRGPYARWVHEHRFLERDGGTECRDRVEYALPVPAPVDRLVDRLLVRRDVERIFAHRTQRLREIFGEGERVEP